MQINHAQVRQKVDTRQPGSNLERDLTDMKMRTAPPPNWLHNI